MANAFATSDVGKAREINEDYFYMTIKNMIDFVTTNRRVSPLTGLPRQCSNSNRN